MNIVSVTITGTGAYLVYAAIRNFNPLTAIKSVLQTGKPDYVVISHAGNQVIPGTATPDPNEMYPNGTPKLWPNGTVRQPNDHLPQNLPPNDPRRIFQPVPAPGQPGDPRPATPSGGSSMGTIGGVMNV